ncbi:tRNA (adenosine(37)-N6)-threonylcarbamoyltransferase complex ATPase subunit type 1 TsaE [Spiroplasma culicicola]|uniref:tRNA threonylcarbamoyladenosine biosynthesis protein TsaE n=1 Tax=Spiroplasma culicicola AES-1 TaxID=1276246 RepID=W6A5Z0_9MOLU|nr:tRNA (adenosine(37)-N6)-threonylcarbamoyltransferase complex ATPase subunit type 1 TsaE [Spiroplasma culicicola]AHI52543.1 hypothetical protein SCULI_v1c02020 [Spiroplasma culicicola AES-1]
MLISSINELDKIVDLVVNECKANVCLLLDGDLGAGKTTFSKVLLKRLGVQENVSSPTFVIMNQYQGENNLNINHMDAYRLTYEEEVDMYLDYFFEAFNIVEWSQNIDIDYEKYFKVIKIKITIIDENSRNFEIKGV